MIRFVFLMSITAMLASCAHGAAIPLGEGRFGPFSFEEADDESDPVQIPMAPPKSRLLGEVWVGYGKALFAGHVVNREPPHPGWGAFYAELLAIMSTAAKWENRKDRPEDPLLQVLIDVHAASFQAEYAIRYLARNGWWIGPSMLEKLRWEAFDAWSRDNLPADHRPLVPVGLLRMSGRNAWRAPPGFIDFQPIQVDPKHCEARGALRAGVLDRWEAEIAGAEPLVVGAESSQDFARMVALRAEDPRAREHGIIWGWRGINALLFEEGFCRAHVGDTQGAEAPLRKLLEFAPTSIGSYTELSHVLTANRSYDEALVLLDRTMELTEDPCVGAKVLRNRGYIYIETGKLALAKNMYLQSLELEPKNDLARHQLRVIETAWKGQGQRERPPAEYTPPPRLGKKLSTCKRTR